MFDALHIGDLLKVFLLYIYSQAVHPGSARHSGYQSSDLSNESVFAFLFDRALWFF